MRMGNEDSSASSGEKETNNTNKQEIKERYASEKQHPRIALAILGVVLVLGAIFIVGTAAMFHHENKVGRNFVSFERPAMMQRAGRSFGRGGMMRGNYSRAGVTGQITAINGNNLTVKNSSGTESTVVVSDTTSYVKAGNIAKQSDLQTNNVVTVVGTSNSQGQIVAVSVQIW
jgi:hypothetical protein